MEASRLVMQLQAIRDAVRDATCKLPTIKQIDVFTDSLGAVKELKNVHKAMEICGVNHKLNYNTATCVQVQCIQGHAVKSRNIAADQQAHCPPDIDFSTIPLAP